MRYVRRRHVRRHDQKRPPVDHRRRRHLLQAPRECTAVLNSPPWIIWLRRTIRLTKGTYAKITYVFSLPARGAFCPIFSPGPFCPPCRYSWPVIIVVSYAPHVYASGRLVVRPPVGRTSPALGVGRLSCRISLFQGQHTNTICLSYLFRLSFVSSFYPHTLQPATQYHNTHLPAYLCLIA